MAEEAKRRPTVSGSRQKYKCSKNQYGLWLANVSKQWIDMGPEGRAVWVEKSRTLLIDKCAEDEAVQVTANADESLLESVVSAFGDKEQPFDKKIFEMVDGGQGPLKEKNKELLQR